MHSNNLNVMSFERGWFFWNKEERLFTKREDLPLLEVANEVITAKQTKAENR